MPLKSKSKELTDHPPPHNEEEEDEEDQYSPGSKEPNKKRSRIPTSCSICRKRKIRCDKKRPTCTACIRSEFSHLCQYEEPAWVSETKKSQIHKNLEFVDLMNQEGLSPEVKSAFQELINRVHKLENGSDLRFPFVDESLGEQQMSRNLAKPYPLEVNLEVDQNDKVDIYDYLPVLVKKGRLEHNGPFTEASILRQDRYTKVIWLSTWKRLESKSSHKQDNSVNDPFVNEAVTNNKFLTGFIELRKQKVQDKKISAELRESQKTLEETIMDVLPDKRIIMKLLFKFFKTLYPYFPLMNENIFFQDLDKILKLSFSDSKIDKLNLSHDKESIALLGILMVILRLSYISLTPEELNEPKFAGIKAHPIESPIIQVAKECLAHYNFLRKSYGLRVLQLTFFLQLYYRYSPEDDHISDQSGGQICLGLLFSMGYSIGIHRNPYIFMNLREAVDRKKEIAQVCRKFWHKLIEMDCVQSVFSGLSLHCVDDRSYDTPLPTEDENDDEVDSWIIKDYKFMEQKNRLFREISKGLLNLHASPSVLDLLKLIHKLENFLQYRIGSLEEILNEPDQPQYAKIKKVSYLIEIHVLLLTLNRQLLTHFENEGVSKQTYIYLTQTISHGLAIHNTLINVLFHEKQYFAVPGKTNTQEFSFFIRPLAALALTKVLIIFASLNSRLIHSKQVSETKKAQSKTISPKNEELMNLTDELIYKVYISIESISGILSRLSVGNYNLSRNLVGVQLFLKELRDFSFINPNFYRPGPSQSRQNSSPANNKDPEPNPLFNHFYDLKLGIIPKENYAMEFIAPELRYLVELLTVDVLKTLKPLYFPPQTQQTQPEPPQPASSFSNSTTPTPQTPTYGQFQHPSFPQYTHPTQQPQHIYREPVITQMDLNNFLFADLPANIPQQQQQQHPAGLPTGFNTPTASHFLHSQSVPPPPPQGNQAHQFSMSNGNQLESFQYLDDLLTGDDFAMLFGAIAEDQGGF